MSVPATDSETGIRQVSFPGLFATASTDDPAAPFSQDYPIVGSSTSSGAFQAVLTNRVGLTATSSSFTLIKDSAAPSVTISAPA